MNRRQALFVSLVIFPAFQAWGQAGTNATVVGAGETLFQVAERTRQPLRALIDANGLIPPYDLRAGQSLKLPAAKVHVVKAGETTSDIAKRYSIDMRSLAVFNKIPKPYTVKVGQRINLPSLVRDRYSGLEPQDLAAVLSGQIAQGKPVSGKNGDAAPTRSPQPAPKPNATLPAVLGPAMPAKPSAVPPRKPPANTPSAPTKPTVTIPQPPARPGTFDWPVRGTILLPFGLREGGARNDGVNIAAPEGADFKAAADGVVAYVGNELVGYGWLVLIKHAGGFITTYAHGSSVVVKEGAKVRKGDVIGAVGSTGRVDRPQLHFEIRNGTKPMNPLNYLGR